MIPNQFRLYLRHKRRMRQARRWLLANDERLVAECMFHLNRYARCLSHYNNIKTLIYALKTPLIQTLYEQGFCTRSYQHEQIKDCWDCEDGINYWSGDFCNKCDGSGIFARHLLYSFHFHIHGRHYSWHQPAILVDWPVELNDHEITEPPALSRRHKQIDDDRRNLYLALIYTYLRQSGIPAEDLPKLPKRTIVGACLSVWYNSRLQYRIRHNLDRLDMMRQNATRLAAYVSTGEEPEALSSPEVIDDELPF